MKIKKAFGISAIAAAMIIVTGCSGNSYPAVDLTEITDPPAVVDFSESDIEVLDLDEPYDFCYSDPETDMIFRYRDGKWIDSIDTGIPIDQDRFSAMADAFLHLRAKEKVADAGSFVSYGTDDSDVSVYITDDAQGYFEIDIGDTTPDGDYYARVNYGNIYIIDKSAVDALTFDYTSLVIREFVNLDITASDIDSVSITVDGKTKTINSSDTDSKDMIAAAVSALEPIDYVSFLATEDDLESTDLTKELRSTLDAVVDVNGEKRSLVIYVGCYADPYQETRNIQFEGSDMIVLVDNDTALDLLAGRREE